MKIRVNTKAVELVSTEQVNTGECNVVTLECELSEEYASTINFAVFKYATLGGEKVIKNRIIDGECKLPVFIDTDKVKIGVYGFELENDELKKRYSPTMVEIDLREGTYQEGIDDYTTEQGTDFERYVAEIEDIIGDIKEVDSIDIVNNHLIVTYSDGTTHDAGIIEGGSSRMEVEVSVVGEEYYLSQSDIDRLYAEQPEAVVFAINDSKLTFVLLAYTQVPGLKSSDLIYQNLNTFVGSDQNLYMRAVIPKISTNPITLLDKDYQEKLESGTNIKTFNGESILGSGNIKVLGLMPPQAYQQTTAVGLIEDTTIQDGWYILGQSIHFSDAGSSTFTAGDMLGIFRDAHGGVIAYVGGNIFVYDGTVDISYYLEDIDLEDYYDKDETDSLLANKQDTLTFDSTPTAASTNPVTSGGIKTYVDSAIGDIDTALANLISGGGVQ